MTSFGSAAPVAQSGNRGHPALGGRGRRRCRSVFSALVAPRISEPRMNWLASGSSALAAGKSSYFRLRSLRLVSSRTNKRRTSSLIHKRPSQQPHFHRQSEPLFAKVYRYSTKRMGRHDPIRSGTVRCLRDQRPRTTQDASHVTSHSQLGECQSGGRSAPNRFGCHATPHCLSTV